MSDLALIDQWTMVGAIFLPFVIAFIIQRGWTVQQQSIAQGVVCTLWGLLGAYIDGAFVNFALTTPNGIIEAVLGSILVTWAWYNTVNKMLPLPQKLEEVTGGDPLVTVTPDRNVA